MYPTWLVVRDHVPVETTNDIENPATPDAELESDIEKAAEAPIVILPGEKGRFASAEAGVGRDTL